ncbi:MAG: DUF3592 domain-containing protein [Ruminococcus sp.]|uniref:DUF3592 domain-containing protein n=1 Tax=Ruminococcus sp. TaxID=41978 RepID=UPI002600D4A0|nr:DUF3592 domain-containing protein [Ruminococcus sp.]MCR5542358.1 DUF3592 domain-containing protein [Ruminococcus sp.]
MWYEKEETKETADPKYEKESNKETEQKFKKESTKKPTQNHKATDDIDYSGWQIVCLFIAVPCIILGIALIYFGYNEIVSHHQCTAQTTGVITDYYVTHTDANGKYRMKGRYIISYTYEANDSKYTRAFSGVSSYAQLNKEIDVRYDPDDPENSYVKGYEETGDWILFIWGIIWTLIWLIIAYVLIRSYLKDKAEKKKKDQLSLT